MTNDDTKTAGQPDTLPAPPVAYKLAVCAREIEVRYCFNALHHWPEAPDEVYFLRAKHAHEFVVTLLLSVDHSDRAREFYMVRADVDLWYKAKRQCTPILGEFVDLGRMSCEEIAEDIAHFLVNVDPAYAPQLRCVRVAEDGINAGMVSFAAVPT